jgi:hypothetical protein
MVIMTFKDVSFDTELESGKAILTAAALAQEARRAQILEDPAARDQVIDEWHQFSSSHRTIPAKNEAEQERDQLALRSRKTQWTRTKRKLRRRWGRLQVDPKAVNQR